MGRTHLSAATLLVSVMVAGLTLSVRARAQSSEKSLSVPAVDVAASASETPAFEVSNLRGHGMLNNTTAAKNGQQDFPPLKHRHRHRFEESNTAQQTGIIATLPSPPAPAFYGDFVAKLVSTGATIGTAKHHNVFVDTGACPGGTIGGCWGNPALFQTDLDASTFIHLSDQYTGSTTNGRYTVGTQVNFTYSLGVPVFYDNDILTIVHNSVVAVKNFTGTSASGYGHIYHMFLPEGADVCFLFAGVGCYAPNFGEGQNTFCAFHFRVNFSDLSPTNVYFTIEPYQDIPACAVPASNPTPPNGQLTDSANSTLSHEFFETITDPDLNTGFRAVNTTFGEIGDLCQSPTQHPISNLNGKLFEIQLEQSNTYQACASSP